MNTFTQIKMPLVFLVEKPGKNVCFAEILGFRLNCRYIIDSSKHEKEELCLLSGHGMRINVIGTRHSEFWLCRGGQIHTMSCFLVRIPGHHKKQKAKNALNSR